MPLVAVKRKELIMLSRLLAFTCIFIAWTSGMGAAATMPTLTVQSFLGEGLGGSGGGSADQTAIHIIVSMMITDPDTGTSIPSPPGSPLSVQAEWPVDCIIEDGSGDGQVRPCHLSMDHPTLFTTNAAGRVSFSIPLASLPSLSSSTHPHHRSHQRGYTSHPYQGLTPALIFHPISEIENDHEAEYTIAHVDLDCIQKLSQVTADQLQHIYPSISSTSSHSLAMALQALMGAATFSVPEFKSVHRLHARSGNKDPVLKGDQLENLKFYDLRKNHVPVYKMDHESMRTYRHRLDRRFVSLVDQSARHAGLAKRSFVPEDTEWLGNATLAEANNGTSSTLLAADPVYKWAVAEALPSAHRTGRQGTVHYSGFLEIQAGNLIQFAVASVDMALHFIFTILKRLELRIIKLLEHVKQLFHWDDILRTKEFLGIYYRLLSPLGFRGLDIVHRGHHHFFTNLSKSTLTAFDHALEHFGVNASNPILKHKKQLVDNHLSRLTKNESTSFNESSPPSTEISAGGSSAYLQDRIINNIPHLKLIDSQDGKYGRPTLEKLIQLLGNVAQTMANTFNREDLEKMMPGLLEFSSKPSFSDYSMAQIFNLFRSITLVSESVLQQMAETMGSMMPAYWNLAVEIMEIEWYLPFVTPWIERVVFRDTGSLVFLDLLTLLGSIIATWEYKTWNQMKAPFTANDIEALSSCTEPELLIYTWNHHPKTYAMDKPELMKYRLGLYDWIPRSHIATMMSLFAVISDATLIIDDKSNAGTPGFENYVPQFLNSIATIMGQVADYPLTQLDKNDAESVRKSSSSPELKFLYFWWTWVAETMMRAARPFAGPHVFINQYPYVTAVNFLFEGMPWIFFGIPIQYQMGATLDASDHAAWAVVDMGWLMIAVKLLSMVAPFGEEFVGRTPFLGIQTLSPLTEESHRLGLGKLSELGQVAWSRVSNRLTIAFDVLVNGIRLSIVNVVMANHIIGMLSNSFQPKNQSFL